MRKMLLAATVFVAVMALTLVVSAQPPGGGPGGPGGRGGRGLGGPGGPGGPGMGMRELLRSPELKEKIGLTDEQIQKLEKIGEEARANRPQGGGGERPSMEQMEKMRQEMQAKFNAVLTPEQQEKMKVLRFQMSGGLEARMIGLDSLDVLNLTDEQKAKLRALDEARREEFRAEMEKRGPMDFRNMSEEDQQKLREEMRVRSEKFRASVETILTAEQKEKAAKLTEEGKELREKFQQQFRGGDRGGRGDRRGGDGPPPPGYRPGDDSWKPGQGVAKPREGAGRRKFPGTDKTDDAEDK